EMKRAAEAALSTNPVQARGFLGRGQERRAERTSARATNPRRKRTAPLPLLAGLTAQKRRDLELFVRTMFGEQIVGGRLALRRAFHRLDIGAGLRGRRARGRRGFLAQVSRGRGLAAAEQAPAAFLRL